MTYDREAVEQNLNDAREIAEKSKVGYPDWNNVMSTVRDQDSLNMKQGPNWKILYHSVKKNPEFVGEYPEMINLVTEMLVNKPGVHNKWMRPLVLAILIGDYQVISRIKNQINKLKERFKIFPREFESVMTRYWSLDYNQTNIQMKNPAQEVTEEQNIKDLDKERAAKLLESMTFQAQSIGHLLGACSYEYPDKVVPLTSTALEHSQIDPREDDTLPADPRGTNTRIKSKSCILKMAGNFLIEAGATEKINNPNPGSAGQSAKGTFSDQNPPGFVDQLIENHKKYLNTSDILYIKQKLAPVLSESRVDLIEPVIPNLIEMLTISSSLTAMVNVARQDPNLLIPYQDKLRHLLIEGKPFIGRDGNILHTIELDQQISAILESVSASRVDDFWNFAQFWINTAEKTSPQIKRITIDLIKEYIQDSDNLDSGVKLLRSLASDPDWQARQRVAEALSEDSSGSYQSLLVELSDDPVPEVQDAATEALNQN